MLRPLELSAVDFRLRLQHRQMSAYRRCSPDMVAKHYGRFLPQDKAAIATKVLNRVWEAA